ncbi:N-6 DNA methylase [Campylobacter majalis]|uniref:N-6 DNA methylase n=1 Tax=Campylobacter majalis TaxID=2790656 RepID=UPI003D69D951
MAKWTLEDDVNDFVKQNFTRLGLKKLKDYNVESSISEYLKQSLKGSAKTANKTNFGKPDFSIEKYEIPVIIENKLHAKKLVQSTKDGIKFDDASISNFAVNGALYYARNMIASGKYDEVIAIGIAGDNDESVELQVYFVYGSGDSAFKFMSKYKTLNFLENKSTFSEFLNDAKLTDDDKHQILISSQIQLQIYAKKLNKLMHNLNITAPQRVLYVSGMLLAMQDIKNDNEIIGYGLTSDDLKGVALEAERDGVKIVNRIKEFLKNRAIPQDKLNLMIASFSEISKDPQRDKPTKNDKEIAKFLDKESSINKQIFTFIYEFIYKQIDGFGGHIDIMGEMYSEFLKYALGDGKELGIVLTPPYVTKMMAQILQIDKDCKVMDLATGSAGFLISAMELMCESANNAYTKNSTQANLEIQNIKKQKLLGVELNAEMYTLAATNMILRGDGSANIQKANAFDTPESLYTKFNANRILLNPPFTFDENGMPFIKFGLSKMQKHGLGAIIIQDSAGSGKAIKSNKEILKHHTLKASIKMPTDLFQPMAGVQTSIYIFEAGVPHDYEKVVKFIDFRNDGYKRTSRALQEIDEPLSRYADIIQIYKNGKNAKVKAKWNLDEIFVEDFITPSGNDWNFDQHKKIDTMPNLGDFKKTVSDYLSWEVSQILSKETPRSINFSNLQKLENEFKANGGEFREFRIGDLFEVKSNPQLNKDSFKFSENGEFPYFTRTCLNNGISGYVEYLDEEHKIKGNSIAVGMLGMQFFYMEKDFYAGQFTKTIYPKFENFNCKIAQYFIVLLNKNQQIYQGVLVRDFEKVFNETKCLLPTINCEIAFDFMEKFIAELEAERVAELEAYLAVTGLKDYKLTTNEQTALDIFANSQNERERERE